MLRLRSSILAHLLSSPAATCPISSLNRLLSAAAARIPPNPSFAVEDYLVDTCGLTRAQALKASTKLSHVKSPRNPDAVLAFLAGLGLSSADVAAAVAKDPKLLCAGVERTLAPVVVGLTGLGLSPSDVARLVSLVPASFRCKPVVSNLQYCLTIFGSYEDLLRALRKIPSLLSRSVEKAVKPKVALLRECGLSTCDIAKLCIARPWLLTTNTERVQTMVACAESLGVPRGSGMFRHTLEAVAFLSEEKIADQIDYLKKTLRWSDVEVSIAMSTGSLALLMRSKETIERKSEFLINEVGLEPAYIAHRPTLFCLSLEGRLKPRYYVVKFLNENGLLDHVRDYFNAVIMPNKLFVEKFICPHNGAAPHLAEDYAAACRGEVPTRFKFT